MGTPYFTKTNTNMSEKEIILVTGGSGYIGSHTVVELLQADYDVIVLDNLSNSKRESIKRAEKLAGRKIVEFYEADCRDSEKLDEIFEKHKIFAVIHFASKKAVGESVSKPLEYFDWNVTGAISLLKAMQKANVFRFVFSSSATVYGDINKVIHKNKFFLLFSAVFCLNFSKIAPKKASQR